MSTPKKRLSLDVAGRTVSISSPDRVYFPEAGITKLDLVEYYIAVADGALRGAGGRPNVLKRYVEGITGDFFFQKRAPKGRPAWIDTVVLRFPSGRQAEEVVPRDAAALAWMAGQGCLDLNPHPVRAEDLDHPDELRVDLDPVPGVEWPQLVEVAKVVRATLSDFALVGWPKTSGSRGIHVNVRLHPEWTFSQVRRAALALAREVERRAPTIATSKWWKEERHGVFLDYNQNAKDRTVASAYSVRPRPDARVSMPLTWDDLLACDPAGFTLRTVPAIVAERGDAHEGIDEAPGRLDGLLELSAKHEADGLGDAPWPPHYEKQPDEPMRVQPSRAREPDKARQGTAKGTGKAKAKARTGGKGTGRRQPRFPLIEIARARTKEEAFAGLERWKARHPEVVPHLTPPDVMVDPMRGRSTTWTRIRINLRHVPEEIRPAQEPLEVDYDPWASTR
ncbi:MAG: DNA polymerase domain-containing protein [Sandaracinaceae bacterium]